MVRTAALLASLLAAASSALTGKVSLGDGDTREFVPGGYIFEFEDGHDASAVLQDINTIGTTRMHLDYKLFKGVSVELHNVKTAMAATMNMASHPAVKNVWPIEVHPMPKPAGLKIIKAKDLLAVAPEQHGLVARDGNTTFHKDTFSTHVMTQVDKLHAEGITGKGIKVAVIDTGVNYKHPALGGCFGKGCLVSFGTDLVGDDYTGSFSKVAPDDDPDDCNGHGTHVSGIIAAQQNKLNFLGAAPDVTLGMYRVFGCSGGVANDILISAFNKAYEDGADIITASLGGAGGWSESPWGVVVSRIVDRGVPCTIAAGNDGKNGLFYPSSAGDANGVISVSSFENTIDPELGLLSSFTMDDGEDEQMGYFVAPDRPNWPGTPMPIYPLSLNTSVEDDACEPLPDDTPDLAGRVVLVRRGTCYFTDKATNVVAKNGSYILFYNNAPGPFAPSVGGAPDQLLAAGMLTAEQGEAFVAAHKAGHNISVTIVSPQYSKGFSIVGSVNHKIGGAVNTFTSWAPTWEMHFKPHVGAPGGQIISTWLGNDYAAEDGTSMATPMVASILALIAQVRGKLDPVALTNLISAYAKPQVWNDGQGFYQKLAPPPQQGAGLIQAYDAAHATTLLEPSSLSFNETAHLAKKLSFKLTNSGAQKVSYTIAQVSALTMYTLGTDGVYPMAFPNEIADAHATLAFSEQKITLRPGASKVVTVSARPPQGLDEGRLPVWSGYVTINGTDGSALSMPYQGLSGSLHTKAVLTQGHVGVASYKNLTLVEDGHVFILPAPVSAQSSDVIGIYANFALGSPKVRCDIVPMTTCPPKNITVDDPLGDTFKTVGQPAGWPLRYVPRGGNLQPWDGQLDGGIYAPPGKYKFVIRALRLFGDETKLEEWDKDTSTSFYIKYQS
ncbi:hypothetical protein JDV02_001049 [Purpureocillium takamizusanense]|uniref:Uncharacterized protein n=1 Tax=Purpureocillium takamizusanense TaxID=2060973 RepID=A0A9Q8V717_9HYPO|nr:uncharacterized protein JDV02_001049 [Purpureocillium takamizusanense]UNI14419.1 hypothetical protein JDV02_001049 [Purpureocillium takamizusanense]